MKIGCWVTLPSKKFFSLSLEFLLQRSADIRRHRTADEGQLKIFCRSRAGSLRETLGAGIPAG